MSSNDQSDALQIPEELKKARNNAIRSLNTLDDIVEAVETGYYPAEEKLKKISHILNAYFERKRCTKYL